MWCNLRKLDHKGPRSIYMTNIYCIPCTGLEATTLVTVLCRRYAGAIHAMAIG